MEIKPYPKNAKRHPDKQLKQIALSLKEYGWQQPIVVDKNGVIIVGHGRWEAYKKYPEGIAKPKISVAKNLTPEQVRGYRLMDNKSNESKWDMALAIEELKELDNLGFDIDLTGFDKDLLIEPDEKDDQIPDSAPTRAKLGDIWQLGRHRVMCGDSTKEEDVKKLMGNFRCDVTFTSPPYNVGHNLGYKGKKSKYKNSNDNLDNYLDLIIGSTQLALKYSNEIFVNIQFLANNKKNILLWLAELSDKFKDIFFWKKLQVQPATAKNVANSQTEIIVLFGQNNNRAWGNKEWRGNFSNFIETNSAGGENKNAKIHNATFPVELPVRFLAQGYKENSLVYDPFLGTGTTLIACQKINCYCYGMELDEKYCDVIIQRYEDYTGNKAVKTAK